MKCPKCSNTTLYVLDSRSAEIDEYETVRRRRVCRQCKYRWTTIEIPMGDRRHHNAIGLLAKIKGDLQGVLNKIAELGKGGEDEKTKL